MKSLRIALACIGSSVAMSAMATGTYDIGHVNPNSSTGSTGFSTAAAANCFMGSAACVAAGASDVMGGTNYGNTYTWNSATSGVGPKVTISAWGSTGASTTLNTAATSTIRKAYLGDYTPAGFGITSQSKGIAVGGSTTNFVAGTNEVNTDGTTNGNGQHAIDNSGSYESLVLSFATAVTLKSLSVGYVNGDSDATVLEYTGAGDPTALLGSMAGESYSQLIANGWKFVANVLDMSTAGPNAINQTLATSSKYWMVGAYMPNLFGNGAGDGNFDEFKLSGFVAASAVPEPGSIALFGIAGVALAISRRRRKA